MFSKPVSAVPFEVSEPRRVIAGMFNRKTMVNLLTGPWCPGTKALARNAAKNFLIKNEGFQVITLRGRNQFNNKVPDVEDDLDFTYVPSTNSSPSNSATIHLVARNLGIVFGKRGGMNFGWLMKQHTKFGDILGITPKHQHDTLPVQMAAGLVKIFEATIAAFPQHSTPGKPEFDLATAEQLEEVYNFIQERVRALFTELKLAVHTYPEFMALMSFDSWLWKPLFDDEEGNFSEQIKASITDGWLRFVCRCCALAPMVTLPLATDPLEMLPLPMLAWLLKQGFITEAFFDEGVDAALGAGITSTLFSAIISSFPEGTIRYFLRDFAKIILLIVVDDEADDFFLLRLLQSCMPEYMHDVPVIHMAAPNVVYCEDPKKQGLDMSRFWKNLLPDFDHTIQFFPDTISNADKVFGMVKSFVDAAEEKGEELKAKLAATAPRVKRARECYEESFGPYNAKKQRTRKDYDEALDDAWQRFNKSLE